MDAPQDGDAIGRKAPIDVGTMPNAIAKPSIRHRGEAGAEREPGASRDPVGMMPSFCAFAGHHYGPYRNRPWPD